MAGFKKVAPMNPSPDPFYLDIYGWDSAYNLTNDGDTPEYSEYQDIHISSSYEYVLEISSDAYRFAGVMSTFFLRTFDFKFNVSEICDIRDEHGELFSGGYYVSGEGNGEQYFSHAITTATITGYLDQQSAWIETGGYFGASNRGTSLIGWLDIAFHGSIDDERSDKLVLGEIS
ncbi:hypothetical protein N7462_008883 [Penicillium macrosclerotiorum]|uniref:uncharacterized protein n=1 Tax=Penicillium macrosclerotiorum TaxID=303699 RepID=UPI002546E93D|nr:uncharacterized protein N7462_008883 [Penicillium macrosclerotiorum]KAJ5675986.1 hypothetical protein N7462_008883 [Penicillium macrosclerotiorum]